MAINKRKILESAQKHLQRGALDKALEDYRTLLKADPHDSNVLLKVGDLYLKQGRRDDAINAYLRVAQQFTRDGFDAKAVALYKQITRLDPKRHDVCVPLADLYARMGLVPDAIAALQAAADAAYRGGDKDGALELLRRMAGLDPSNTQSRLKVADLLAKEKRSEEALAEYQAVVEELERRGEDEQRIKVLERMLALDSGRGAAALTVARARLDAGDFAAARKLAEQLLATQPDDLDGREILGHALAGLGDVERSRETFRELAEMFRLRGDEARARDLMQRFGGLEALAPDEADNTGEPVLELEAAAPEDDFVLEADPLPAPAKPLRAPPRGEPPRVEKPREPARLETRAPAPAPRARAAAPPRPAPAAAAADETGDPDQLLAEATVYLRYGKYERAVSALRSILAQDPGHRGALEGLGEAFSASGEKAHALTAWQRAAEAARAAGDTAAVARIRERLASLDAAAAAALAAPEPAAAEDEGVEIDIDLSGSFEIEEDSTLDAEQGPARAAASDEEVLSIDLDSIEPLGGDASEQARGGAQPAASAGISLAPEEPTATTPARVADDLEEAEFYFAQGLLDEARAFYERILAAAPNHPQAMLRLGEIAARSGAAPKAAPAKPEAARATRAAPPAPEPTLPTEPALAAAPPPEREGIELASPEPELEIDFGTDLDLPEPDDATPTPLELAPPPPPEPPPPAPARAPAPPPPAPARAEPPPLRAEPARPAPAPRPAPAAPAPRPAPARPAPTPAPPAAALASPPPDVTSPTFEAAGEESGDYDLAAMLSGSIGADESAVRTLAGTEEEAFEQVFQAFKTGVERELGEGDHEARYDLGIAYKEMGLLEDAIAAFQLAMAAPARRLACLHMLGLCALDLGRANDAVAHLEQALSLPDLPADQRAPLRYDAGRAYAALGDVARARAAFEEVRSIDPGFGDVEGELARLAKAKGAAAPAAAAETYESFDDLLGETPEPAAKASYESFDDLFGDDDADEAPEPAAAAEEPPPEPEPPAPRRPAPRAEPEREAPPAEPPPAGPGGARRRRKISFV